MFWSQNIDRKAKSAIYESLILYIYAHAYMGAKAGALPNSCTPSYANFTLNV